MPGSKDYLVVTRALRSFDQPDTSSEVEGYVQPGQYEVLEVKKNHPTTDTDYVRIYAPTLGTEDTWVCSRWKTTSYTSIITKTIESIQLDFSTDPLAIEENNLTNLLPEFYDFRYDLDEAYYPYPLPGFNAPQAPPKQNNCCTFVEALLVKAWTDSFDTVEWNRRRHGQMMIFSSDDYYSPITALVETNIGELIEDEDNGPPPWTVIQGWRKQWTSGHTFIIVKHDPETDRVLTLESNSYHNLNGVGFRKIGNLRNFNKPPIDWWHNEELWTWEKIKSVYRYRKACALKVKDLSWVPTESVI